MKLKLTPKEQAQIKKAEAELKTHTEKLKTTTEAKAPLQAEFDKLYVKLSKYSVKISRAQAEINNVTFSIKRIKEDAAARSQPWFKWIGPGGKPPMADSKFRYDLPTKGRPGRWHRTKRARLCYFGFHACRAKSINGWKRPNTSLYLVEVSGQAEHDTNKSTFTQMRVIRKVTPARARELAARAAKA